MLVCVQIALFEQSGRRGFLAKHVVFVMCVGDCQQVSMECPLFQMQGTFVCYTLACGPTNLTQFMHCVCTRVRICVCMHVLIRKLSVMTFLRANI